MVRQYLKLENGKWKEVEQSDFWIDVMLLKRLNFLKKIQDDNWDGVIIIDGKERSGKSVLGMVIGHYLSNGKLGINNFARGLNDAKKKIRSLPDKSVLIMDEGSLIFSSKDSLSKAQKDLVKIMDVVGQKNMIFIICLPCFFDLNKTIAVRRSLFLLHVYPDANYKRGRYGFFGEGRKKLLYAIGKRKNDSYSFPRAEYVSYYMDFEPDFYQEYLEKVKKESLDETLSINTGDKESKENKLKEMESKFYYWMRINTDLSLRKLSEVLNRDHSTVRDRINEYVVKNNLPMPSK